MPRPPFILYSIIIDFAIYVKCPSRMTGRYSDLTGSPLSASARPVQFPAHPADRSFTAARFLKGRAILSVTVQLRFPGQHTFRNRPCTGHPREAVRLRERPAASYRLYTRAAMTLFRLPAGRCIAVSRRFGSCLTRAANNFLSVCRSGGDSFRTDSSHTLSAAAGDPERAFPLRLRLRKKTMKP